MIAGASEGELPEPGVSEALARERANSIGDLQYELALTIPRDCHEPVRGRVIIRFTLAAPHRVVLDFDRPPACVGRMRIGGAVTEPVAAQGHIIVPAERTDAGLNEIAVDFTAGDEVLNRRDGLLYTLFVPARAHRAFPCFDQPDLKGRLTLSLDVPFDWQAVANASEVGRTRIPSGWRIQFAETRPLPTYLFAFVAGHLAHETAIRGARTFRIVHHDADAADLARNRTAIVDLHARALDWLEQYTGMTCPFEPFDIVLIPSFQFRGMEHPGAVLYDAARLLLPPSPTQTHLLERASLIAHETAHMWFGNLVTMSWFSDVWLKEVFANLMAAKIVEPAFPELHHAARFLLSHHPEAYQVDRTAGANPIRQPLRNLRDAGQLYGPIVYQKTVIVMRQLETMLGADAFQEAVREYLRQYAFGNASWPDLLRILGTKTPHDLAAWSHAWVEERGRPEVTTRLHIDRTGCLAGIELVMRDPIGRDLVWPQTLPIAVGDPDSARELSVRMSRGAVRVPGTAGLDRPRYVLPGGELGYGLFVLDEATRQYLLDHIESVPDALTRAGAWVTLWENVLAGHVAPSAFLHAALRALSGESEEQTAERVIGWVVRAFWRLLSEPERARHGPAVESWLRLEIERAPTSSRKAACFNAFRDIAHSPAALGWLTRIWRRDGAVPGVSLGEADEMALVLELAVRGVPQWDEMLRAQIGRTTQPDRRAECAFVMPAVSADPQEREAAFDRFRRVELRRREPWVLQSLRYLNHPLREAHARRFIRPALELLREVQRTGDIFFPARWVEAALWGHRSPEAARIVQGFLDRETTLPRRLRWVVLTAADDLFRAAARTSGT